MRRKEHRSALCGVCALMLAAALAALAVAQDLTACRSVRSDVLRLHVIANSDSAADQAVKLAVRDALLSEGAALFNGSVTVKDAEAKLRPQLGALEAAANRVLREQGFGYTARAALTCEYFTARAYNDITLPAGNYTALKVTLGGGAGQNWWCVMFPPLCLPAAQPAAADVFSSGEMRVLSPAAGYQVRFKLAEWLEELWEKLENR